MVSQGHLTRIVDHLGTLEHVPRACDVIVSLIHDQAGWPKSRWGFPLPILHTKDVCFPITNTTYIKGRMLSERVYSKCKDKVTREALKSPHVQIS